MTQLVTVDPNVEEAEALTVCLIAYNHARYIRQALDALAAQTYTRFKIVACDDGSTDGTYEILKDYESGLLSHKLQVVTHPGHINKGISNTYNLCLDYVDTPYFMGHASDDVLEPDAIEYFVDLMETNPEVEVLYGPGNVIDENDSLTGKAVEAQDIGQGREAQSLLIRGNELLDPSMIFRRSCMGLVVLRPGLVYGDWYRNLVLAGKCTFLYYPIPKVRYRIHGANVSIGNSPEVQRKQRREVDQALIEDDIFHDTPGLKSALMDEILSDIDKSSPVFSVLVKVDTVIKNYEDQIVELFKNLSEEQKKGVTEGRNVYLPLAKRLADYGNKMFTGGSFKIARQYYMASLRYNRFSFRVFIHAASTYFPLCRRV